MKRLLYVVAIMLLSSISSLAQDDDPIQSDVSEEIWGKKQTKGFDKQFDGASDAKLRPPSKPNVVNTPFDAGILVLLGAGALYGRKRLTQKRIV